MDAHAASVILRGLLGLPYINLLIGCEHWSRGLTCIKLLNGCENLLNGMRKFVERDANGRVDQTLPMKNAPTAICRGSRGHGMRARRYEAPALPNAAYRSFDCASVGLWAHN